MVNLKCRRIEGGDDKDKKRTETTTSPPNQGPLLAFEYFRATDMRGICGQKVCTYINVAAFFFHRCKRTSHCLTNTKTANPFSGYPLKMTSPTAVIRILLAFCCEPWGNRLLLYPPKDNWQQQQQRESPTSVMISVIIQAK